MKIDDLEVVIAGGATAGAAAALLLARAGARVTLIERLAAPAAVGAGLAVAENGLAVLESLGLLAAVERAGRTVPRPRVVDGGGRVLLSPEGPEPRVRMVRRSALQQILLDALAAEPRITRRFGTEVLGSDGRGTVEVRLGDGVTDRLRGELVIGADGVHSRLRSSGDFGAQVSRPGVSYVRVLVDAEVARGEEAWTAAGLFGSFAVEGGTYVYASVGGAEAQAALAARDLDAFRVAWSRAYPPASEILGHVERFEQLLVNPVIQVVCRRWFDRQTVLMGDAAHAMAPNLGQGANSALVDAAVLLDELRRAGDLPGALLAYQQRRQPAVQVVQRTAARLGSLAEVTHPVARWARDRLLLPVVTRLAPPLSPSTVFQEPSETLVAIGRA